MRLPADSRRRKALGLTRSRRPRARRNCFEDRVVRAGAPTRHRTARDPNFPPDIEHVVGAAGVGCRSSRGVPNVAIAGRVPRLRTSRGFASRWFNTRPEPTGRAPRAIPLTVRDQLTAGRRRASRFVSRRDLPVVRTHVAVAIREERCGASRSSDPVPRFVDAERSRNSRHVTRQSFAGGDRASQSGRDRSRGGEDGGQTRGPEPQKIVGARFDEGAHQGRRPSDAPPSKTRV